MHQILRDVNDKVFIDIDINHKEQSRNKIKLFSNIWHGRFKELR